MRYLKYSAAALFVLSMAAYAAYVSVETVRAYRETVQARRESEARWEDYRKNMEEYGKEMQRFKDESVRLRIELEDLARERRRLLASAERSAAKLHESLGAINERREKTDPIQWVDELRCPDGEATVTVHGEWKCPVASGEKRSWVPERK